MSAAVQVVAQRSAALPKTAVWEVNRSPVSCIPSPESPANLMITRFNWTSCLATLAPYVTSDSSRTLFQTTPTSEASETSSLVESAESAGKPLSKRTARDRGGSSLTAVIEIATLRWHGDSSAAPAVRTGGRSGGRIRVFELALACCAVESARAWRVLASASDSVAGWSVDSDRDDKAPEPIDVLVVSGTVTVANVDEVRQAYDLLARDAQDLGRPVPRVVALGVCAISGGPFWDSYAVIPGISDLMPVHVSVPGCPPRPDAVFDALRDVLRDDMREGLHVEVVDG